MNPRFELTLDRDVCTPGDTLRGTVLVLEGGASRSLEALLEYNEETDDYSGVATSISSGPLHHGDLVTGMTFEFELQVPPEAYPNYRSDHGLLYWEVHIRSDERGPDTHERRRIVVETTHGRPGTGT